MMSIAELRKEMGYTQKEFANYFDIPLRTIQKWERNGSTPPDYINKMMERIIKLEKIVNQQ